MTSISCRKTDGCATQKNWIIPQASHPWIFLVDCDERCTPELATEVQRVLEEGPTHWASVLAI